MLQEQVLLSFQLWYFSQVFSTSLFVANSSLQFFLIQEQLGTCLVFCNGVYRVLIGRGLYYREFTRDTWRAVDDAVGCKHAGSIHVHADSLAPV